MATIQPFKMLSDNEREALLKELNYHQKSVTKKTTTVKTVKRVATSSSSNYINNKADNPFANFCKKAVNFVKDNMSLTLGVGDHDGDMDKSFDLGDVKDIITGDKELKANISIGPIDVGIGASDVIKAIDFIGGGFRTY